MEGNRRRIKQEEKKEEVRPVKRRFDTKNKNSDIGVPSDTSPFISNLFRAIVEQKFAKVVSWGEKNGQFVIHDMEEFKKHILPTYFKTTSYATFIRQVSFANIS